MSDLFVQAMNKLTLFRAESGTSKLADAIAEVTGISLTHIAIAERAAVAKRTFRPLRDLLENQQTSKASKLRYRVSLKQAKKRSKRTGEIIANKLELTITTDRGVVHCEADVYVVHRDGIYGNRQSIQIDIRYTVYTGFRKQQFRQNLKLSSQPQPFQNWAPQWSEAA